MVSQQLIGLDLGKVRTGVATASTIAKLAQPLRTVPTDELVEQLKKLMSELDVKAIVVGLPRNLNGDDTSQTDWAREWIEQAKSSLPNVPIYWQDEALTSKMAEEAAGKKVTDIDSQAAAIILQDFLDSEENHE
jgi:putative Holliday junction resolvase